MLAKLQQLFQSSGAAATNDSREHALELAAAVLLVEVSMADFDINSAERQAVFDALSRVFRLNGEELKELAVDAERTVQDATSLHAFTRVINDQCSREEKLKLLEQFWRVAYADGRIDKYEDHRIRRLSDLLHLSHKEFMQAKLKVLNKN